MQGFIGDIITYVIAPVATALVGWMAGRRKTEADSKKSEIENVEAILTIYQRIIKDLEAKVERLEVRLDDAQKRYEAKVVELQRRLNEVEHRK
ncbi:MAG: hypothetical protein H0X62_05940 [Bacteroidetes bacterium]|nr:hypothetical protein [Bacteroidota bacterium]